MRIILITLLLSLSMTTSTLSWASPNVYINGTQKDLQVIQIDGKSFVPLRVITESLGSKVEWKETDIYITPDLKRPSIKGEAKYTNMINKSLDLLSIRNPVGYILICKYVSRINVDNKPIPKQESDYYAYTLFDTVTVNTNLLEDKEKNIPEFLAAILVHEGVHAAQNGFQFTLLSNKEDIEKEAYVYALNSLWLLNAPKWSVDEVLHGLGSTID